MNTQKLLVLVFLLSMVLGMGHSAYQGASATPDTIFNNTVIRGEDFENVYQDDNTAWGSVKKTTDSYEETTVGNTIKMGYEVFKIFLNGINPFSIGPGQYTSYIEKSIAYAIMLFRVIVMLFVGLELYFVIKNQKAS